MFSYKDNAQEIWNEVFSNFDNPSREIIESESEDEDELSSTGSLCAYGGGRSSPVNLCRPSIATSQPTITICEYALELSEEEIERRFQASRDLLKIRIGPFGKPKPYEPPVYGEFEQDNQIKLIEETEIEVSFKFQFLIITEKLKVTISEIKNLDKFTSANSQMYVEACLMPGKVQKLRTKTVDATDNMPIDSVMFFNGFDLDQMHQMTLRLVLHVSDGENTSPNNGQRAFSRLGEVNVSLENFDITSEIRLTESLNTRIATGPGGFGSVRMKLLSV